MFSHINLALVGNRQPFAYRQDFAGCDTKGTGSVQSVLDSARYSNSRPWPINCSE